MKPTKGPAKPKKPFDKPQRPFSKAGQAPGKKPFRTRTYHRNEGDSPTSGFDKGGTEERPLRDDRPMRDDRPVRQDRPPRPERPFRPARMPVRVEEAPRPEPRPAPAPPQAGDVAVMVPAALAGRLEAHAAQLGVDMQSLIRVWLADKLRPQK